MKFSREWLQDYIVETLPENAVIQDALNKKAFEVEEIVVLPTDTVFDIKVLPNRAHDALGHRGMACELCACLDLHSKEEERARQNGIVMDNDVALSSVNIEDAESCTRFMSMRIDNVCVGESPALLKERLSAIGQRSINNIVDITNFVQFSLNKPMHAYDAEKIKGPLTARFAKSSEALTTLDEKELLLDESTLVIADDEKVLGLAGIKGGKWSGITEATTSIILESANFNPVLIRKTSQKYDIKTDASKRFENGIANSLVEEGLYMTAYLIKEACPEAVFSLVTDEYPHPDAQFSLTVPLSDINGILGASYDERAVEDALRRLAFSYEKNREEYVIAVPSERLDIRIKEDIAEEVGRIIGYDTLTPVLPDLSRIGLVHKRMAYENKVRTFLINAGFSEVMTYTFGNEGKVEIVKGLSKDKEKLRASLGSGIREALSLNIYNAPLIGEKNIKIFEFGNVFTEDTETRHLAIGVDDGSKKGNFEEVGKYALACVKEALGGIDVPHIPISQKPFIAEINFDAVISQLPEVEKYEAPAFATLSSVTYTHVSQYPFIARDIAMWVPEDVTWESIHKLCIGVNNSLVTRIDLFDTFQKEMDGKVKTSFAFRLIFQSYERTLTDDEVNVMMKPYYEVLVGKGYEIR